MVNVPKQVTQGGSPLRRLLLSIIFLLMLSMPMASAHSGGVTALVSMEPTLPLPGTIATLLVKLYDPYMVPITEGKLRVTMALDGQAQPPFTPLTEQGKGKYGGPIQVAPAGLAILHVEADLSDGTWSGALPFRIGVDGTIMDGSGVQLLPVEPKPAPTLDQPVAPPWGLLFTGGGALLLVAFGLLWFRHSR
jgi:hypothetical protein